MKGISRTCGYDDNRDDDGKKLHESCMSHLNASAVYPIGIVNVKSFVSKKRDSKCCKICKRDDGNLFKKLGFRLVPEFYVIIYLRLAVPQS